MSIRVGILGAGGWGTALALALDYNHHDVTLWEFNPEAAAALRQKRENTIFLPGIPIPETIHITHELEQAVRDMDYLVIALPTHVVREVTSGIAGMISEETVWISGSKGIENTSWKRNSEVLKETVNGLADEHVVVLSGPSHAEELARRNPTVVVAASTSEETSRRVQEIFMSPFFRLYTSSDVTGVELGGALKNVIAIAAGIIDGLGLGDNLKAALINRGLVEMTRLGTSLGANPLTFAGLSGMGDLIVTCTSRHSRNRYVGEEIGKGRTLEDIMQSMVMVAEGVRTTRSAYILANLYRADMPITHEVYQVLFENKDPSKAVTDLMTRDAKAEDWG